MIILSCFAQDCHSQAHSHTMVYYTLLLYTTSQHTVSITVISYGITSFKGMEHTLNYNGLITWTGFSRRSPFSNMLLPLEWLEERQYFILRLKCFPSKSKSGHFKICTIRLVIYTTLFRSFPTHAPVSCMIICTMLNMILASILSSIYIKIIVIFS